MSESKEGELKKQIKKYTVSGGQVILNEWRERQEFISVPILQKVLDEAKADFPKPVPFDHPFEDNPDSPCNDPEEFYAWFKKWFGE